VNLYSAYR